MDIQTLNLICKCPHVSHFMDIKLHRVHRQQHVHDDEIIYLRYAVRPSRETGYMHFLLGFIIPNDNNSKERRQRHWACWPKEMKENVGNC